jgi:hypothetical protein
VTKAGRQWEAAGLGPVIGINRIPRPLHRGMAPAPAAGLEPLQPGSISSSADQIAASLLADGEFRALKLGTWLSAPEGEFVSAAATSVMPSLYQADAEVLIKALQLAAKQQAEAWKTIMAGVAIGGVLLAIGKSGK